MADITRAVDIDTAKDIMEYAKDHYNEGWDVIRECYSLNDIIELTGSAGSHSGYSTYKEALAKVADFVEVYNDRKADIQAEAF